MQRRTLLLSLSSLPLWHAALPALANGPAQVAPAWHEALPHARLLGQGDFRWLGLRLYTARLWVDTDWPKHSPAMTTAPWQDHRFVLALDYHRRIRRDQFVDASLEEIARIGEPPSTASQRLAWQAAMQQAWQDVQPGDQLCGLHLPGQGCRFYSRHRHLADIPDAHFAQAFFAIWLHARTRDAALRRQLLGLVA